jgi:hypothetical protein
MQQRMVIYVSLLLLLPLNYLSSDSPLCQRGGVLSARLHHSRCYQVLLLPLLPPPLPLLLLLLLLAIRFTINNTA